MKEQYSSDEAWQEAEAMRHLAEGAAQQESRSTTGADYEKLSRAFDTLKSLDPEAAAGAIEQLAMVRDEKHRLGQEGYQIVSHVGDEVVRELWPKFQTVGSLMRDNLQGRSHEEIREELADHIVTFVQQIRDRVLADPRVRQAFAGREEVLSEHFSNEALRAYEDRLKKQLGLDF